jgi:hypothetical protein
MEETKTVACTLTSTGMGERRARWHELAGHAFLGRVITERGLRLEFSREAEGELRELALLERDCCRFAGWEVTTVDGLAVLDVTGDGDESIGAVQSMFTSLEPPANGSRRSTSEV